MQFEDRSRAEPFSTTLRPIEFDLTDFRTAPDFENKYRFSAQSAAGERLDWAGQFTLQPLGSNGEFTIAQLKALTIANYLQNALPFDLVGGSLDIQGSYQLHCHASDGLVADLAQHQGAFTGDQSGRGRSAVAAGSVSSAGAAPWVSLPELEVSDTSVSLSERRVTIGQVLLQRAALQLWRNADGSLNLQQLAGAPKTARSPRPHRRRIQRRPAAAVEYRAGQARAAGCEHRGGGSQRQACFQDATWCDRADGGELLERRHGSAEHRPAHADRPRRGTADPGHRHALAR